MNKTYLTLRNLEDYYKKMKKKYPRTSEIWDDLIKLIDSQKRDLLSGK